VKRLVLAYAGLLAIGAAWGLSAPVIRYATGAGFGALTILLVQSAVNVTVLGVFLAATGRLRRLPLDGGHLRLYAVVGLCGIALPGLASYSATAHLPAGIISIVISLVPLFALPLALALGTERFSARRLSGVMLGGAAMALLIGPDASLPDPAAWVWVPVAALAPLLYAVEGAYVYASRARRADLLQTLWAGYAIGLALLLPLAVVTPGPLWPERISGLAVAGFLSSGFLGISAYAGYLFLLRNTGAVFGAQVAYTVTGMGIVWSMSLLGERYAVWVWVALGLLFAGLFLVQPRGVVSEIAADLTAGESNGVV